MMNAIAKTAKKMMFSEEFADRIFFTADTHFGHENIIRFCNRPFVSIEEHDKELIRRWNAKVPKNGIVFHLGDVGFGDTKRIHDILTELNGSIYLVIGNHDWRNIVSQHAWRFRELTQQINMKIGDTFILLNHYPMLCYAGTYRKENPTYQLFGHVHTSPYSNAGLDTPRLDMLFPTQYDVGVDNNDFTPISWKEVNEKIKSQILIDDETRNLNFRTT